MNETVGLVGLAVVLAKALDKTIEFIISKMKTDRKQGASEQLETLRKIDARLTAIESLLDKTDINGAPMIYFPRNIEARQIESLNMLNDQAHSQETNVKIFDKLVDKVISIENTTSQILHEVRK